MVVKRKIRHPKRSRRTYAVNIDVAVHIHDKLCIGDAVAIFGPIPQTGSIKNIIRLPRNAVCPPAFSAPDIAGAAKLNVLICSSLALYYILGRRGKRRQLREYNRCKQCAEKKFFHRVSN